MKIIKFTSLSQFNFNYCPHCSCTKFQKPATSTSSGYCYKLERLYCSIMQSTTLDNFFHKTEPHCHYCVNEIITHDAGKFF